MNDDVRDFLLIVRFIGQAETNRFGKLRIPASVATDLRLLAVKYKVTPSETTIEQLGKVAAALLAWEEK